MTTGLLVCIVDDEEMVRDSLAGLLRSAGFHAAAFASAEEFLDSADRSAMRCMILDVTMPAMSGQELQERLLAEGHPAPIIFITGRPDEHTRRLVLARGALGYLVKPFDEDELLGAVRAATGLR